METTPSSHDSTTTQCHASTSVGRVRTTNEDRFGINEKLRLFIVADGIGGHVAGEVAAQMAVDRLPRLLLSALKKAENSNPEALLQGALEHTSAYVWEQAQRNTEWTDMGTTVVALWITQGRAIIAHMGDSRVYLCRLGETMRKLTTDHTLVELLLESGDLSPEEAAGHPLRHQLTRVCGMDGEPVADVSSLELQTGDLFLLCTDGITNELKEREIEAQTHEEYPARAIVDAALEAGGLDNATALTVQITISKPETQVDLD